MTVGLVPPAREASCTQSEDDARYMAAALMLARRGLGRVAPNPAVGALIVKDSVIIGHGFTDIGGRPHAETIALRQAGSAAQGATLYVTLEPCSHYGRTPPCAEAIVAAGIARVVSALGDPDPRVSGEGHARLAAAGIALSTGVCADAAKRLNLGHFLRVTEGRPMLTLKLAETADGYAAGPAGMPRLRITGKAANAHVHMLRALHDAILVGGRTALADDPLLTIRLPGMEMLRPLRIVIDSELALPASSQLAATAAQHPTLVIATPEAPAEAVRALEAKSIEILRVPRGKSAHVELATALAILAKRGLTRIFCEGGPRLAAALLERGCVDEIVLLTSKARLAAPGLPALDAVSGSLLSDPTHYCCVEDRMIEQDRLRRYEREL